MSLAVSPSSGRPYGLARVCRVWRAARATIYRHRLPPRAQSPRRPGPVGPMPDPALVETIRAVLAASPFHGEGHRKVWARLRMKGVRTSRRRTLRLMREHGLLAPSRVGSKRGPRNYDGTIIPETLDTMWGTDMTTTWTGESQTAVFVAIDHHSAECIGLHAAPARHPLRSSGTSQAGRPPAFRRLRRRRRGGPLSSPRSRQPIHVRRVPERAEVPRHRELTRLCSRAGGQWLRRTLHPHPQGEPPVGADLRHRRTTPPGAARVPPNLQLNVADRAPRLQNTRRRPPGSAFHCGPCRLSFNKVSQQPRPVHG